MAHQHVAACIHWLRSYRVLQIHYKFAVMEEMTLKELAEKLRQRNAKVSGRKKDLVERKALTFAKHSKVPDT